VTIPVELSFQGLPHSNAIEEAVAHQLSRLERLRSHITRCRVSLSQEAKHQQQGRPFSVRVDLMTPLSDRIFSDTSEQDPYVALREAFARVERMLIDATQKQRNHSGQPADPAEEA